VELHGALGDVQFIGDLSVGKVFEQRVEDLLLAP